MNWGDPNLQSGVVRVRHGKGQKDRTVITGAKTMQALFRYRRTLKQPPAPDRPLIRGYTGWRMTPNGLWRSLRKLGVAVGVKATPHAVRRTFALMSLRSGTDILSLQRLMGHSDIAKTTHHVQMLDADLIAAHREHGIDSWL